MSSNSTILEKKLEKFNNWQKKRNLDNKKHQTLGLKFCLSIELQEPIIEREFSLLVLIMMNILTLIYTSGFLLKKNFISLFKIF